MTYIKPPPYTGKGVLEITQELRDKIKELEIENDLNAKLLIEKNEEIEDLNNAYMELLARFNKFESGSNKSALNIHIKGKERLQRYIDSFYPQYATTGDFLRHSVEVMTGLNYYDIISGEWNGKKLQAN